MLNNNKKYISSFLLKFSLLIYVICSPITAYLQGYSFLSSLTSTASSYQVSIRAVKSDAFGNKFIAGNFDVTATLKNTTFNGNSKDIFISKLDPYGNPIWVTTAGGAGSDQAMDIELDDQGGVYVSGLFSTTATFSGDTVVSAVQPSANAVTMSDNFLAKYDTSGNFIWIKVGATTDNDFNNNVNSFNNNAFNYYGRSKLKYKNGHIYLMASNRVSVSSTGSVNSSGRQFDGIALPNTQAPGGGGFYGYKYLNSFILKTDVSGNNSWLTPVYCNTTSDFDATIGLDFDVNSDDHVIAEYYYSNNGVNIAGPNTTNSINGFSTASTFFDEGGILILELDSSGNYNNDFSIFNTFPSYNTFSGFGNSIDYISYGLSVDNADNIFFVFNNQNNGLFNQNIANITIPETSNTIVKLNPNLLPVNCKIFNSFPSVSRNNFPISALETKDDNLVFGGILDASINIENNLYTRSDEITFINMDTNLFDVNWITSTTNSSVPVVDGSGFGVNTPFFYSLGIHDLDIGVDNRAVFCGNIGSQYRSFGDYTTSTDQFNDAFITEIIPCNPVYSQVTPSNPVICGAGNAVSLNANLNQGISYQWIDNGSLTSIDNNPVYTTNNTGDYSILTDSLGCKDTSNVVNVTIAPLPSVSVPLTPFTVCLSGGPVVVPDGTPAGGVWSGLGMINDSVFDPNFLGPGPSLINYSYTNSFGCSDDAVQIANTVTPPPLFVSNSIPNFCENDGPYSLGGSVTPAGGSYTGPGVSGSTFNPASAGVGTHLIRYKYTVAQNCSDSIDFYLVVNANPAINYPLFDSICENNNALPLFSATPYGGTYSGPYVISNTFYPFLSGDGSFPITYSVTENGCSSTSTRVLKVDANENAQLDSMSSFCVNDESIPLTIGTPVGGVYKIDGIIKDSLKPAELGAGTHSLAYTFTNSCGTSTDLITFEIYDIPIVSLNQLGPYCANDSSFILDMGQPSGGIYQILNDTISIFDPSVYNPGNIELNYIYVDQNGCSNETTDTIAINEFPSVNAGADVSICSGDSIILRGSGASSYTWDNSIKDDTAFSPNTTTTYTVTGTDANGCQNTDQLTVTVNALPTVSAGTDQTVCFGDNVTLSGSGASTYSWDNGVTNNTSFTASATTTYTVSGTDENGCQNTDQVTVRVNALPTVSAGADQTVCFGDDVTLSGSGASTYGWDNDITDNTAFTASSTTTYTLTGTDGNGCQNTDQVTVSVNALPTVSAGADQTVCFGDDVTLAGSGASTYSWDNSVTDGVSFSPSQSGIYRLMGTDTNGCENTDQLEITVFQLPNVNLYSLTPICNVNSGPVQLSGGTPQGGQYDGFAVSNNRFDPAISGSGFFQVDYSYVDSNGCSSTASQIITVDTTNINISQLPFSSLCHDDDSLILTGASPGGGTYSGQGVVNGVFYPSLVSPGTIEITYSYLELNSCLATRNEDLVVNPLPTVSLNQIDSTCLNDDPITLNTGVPLGGVYSGVGVVNGTFDPSLSNVGANEIFYSYTDVNGCVNETSIINYVKALPTVNLSLLNSLCEDASPETLSNGSPVGGTYSGNGVFNGSFYPDSTGAGIFNISYTTELNGCFATDSSYIEVFALPTLSVSSLPELCVYDTLLLDLISPVGGVYTGLGVLNDTFSANDGIIGQNSINYSFTDQNNCSNSIGFSLTVHDLPSLSQSSTSINSICSNESSIALQNFMPLGGVYTGPGVTNNIFDPALAAFGLNEITYQVTDSNNCMNIISDTIFVNLPPYVSIVGFDVCANDSVLTLSSGFPSGGIYSGPGISNGIFDPSLINDSNTIYTYQYSDSNNCTSVDSALIRVNSLPNVQLLVPNNICPNAPNLNLNGGSPVGGIYSGVGVIGDDFDPSLVGTNNAIIQYAYTDSNNCTVSVSNSIFVFPFSSVNVSGDTDVCEGSSTTLTASGADYYIWNNTDTSDLITISPTTDVGFSLISYDSNDCQYNDSVFVHVNPIPSLIISGPDTICQDSVAVYQALTTASSYFWNTNDTTPSISVGPYPVGSQLVFSVGVTDTNGCTNNDFTTLHVQQCSLLEMYHEENGDVIIYPNPSTGEFYVELFNFGSNLKQIQVLDVTGKVISEQTKSCEDCILSYQQISSGIYFIIVKSSHFSITKKLIVKQ